MCDEFEVVLGELPQEFLGDLMREFVAYSVAISRVERGNPESFAPLGTGTFVKKGNRYGILTAHHCLHRCIPEVSIGPQGKDCLLLIFKDGKDMRLEPEELFEHELATPVCDEFGPDLTFIEIAPCEKLGTLKAIVSFWNLDRNVEDILEKYGRVQTPLASIGYPEEICRSQIDGRSIHRMSYDVSKCY